MRLRQGDSSASRGRSPVKAPRQAARPKGVVVNRAFQSAARSAAACLVALALGAGSVQASQGPSPAQSAPMLGYASLKVEGAPGRHGPGPEHRIDWIYERPGLPFEVTATSGPWRRVRDPDGAQVWIHARNLSTQRTAYIAGSADVPLRTDPRTHARTLAILAPGVVARFTGCRGDWRRIAVAGRVGWVRRTRSGAPTARKEKGTAGFTPAIPCLQ